MLRFRLLGIPFEVAPYFWLISAALGGNDLHGENGALRLAVWVACVFVSIVVHELGHALTARRYGANPLVRMYALGGVTQMRGGQFTRGQGFQVVLGGPMAGLGFYWVVRVGVYLLANSVPAASVFLESETTAGSVAAYALDSLLYINLYWTLFNLLPVLPLDGGLIMGNVLGPGQAALARGISVVAAVGCAVGAYLFGQLYMAFFFGFLAYQNIRGGGALPGSVG